VRAGPWQRPRRLRASTARGLDRQGRPQPSALSLGAGPPAGRPQAGRHLHAGAPRVKAPPPAAGGAGRRRAPRRVAGQGRRGGAGRRRDDPEGGAALSVLVFMDQGEPALQSITLARTFGGPVHGLPEFAVRPFAPDALAAVLQQAADDLGVTAVFAAGTERGNDVM